MKIAFCLSQIDATGPFLVARAIISGLLSRGHDIRLYHVYGTPQLEMPLVSRKIGYTYEGTIREMDVIHSHGFRADVATHWNRKLHRIPTLCTIHQYNEEQIPFDYSNQIKRWVVKTLWKRALQTKDLVVGINPLMVRYYSEYLHHDRCNYVLNGVNPEYGRTDPLLLRKIRELKTRYVLIGGAGHLVTRKGFDRLIRLLAREPSYFAVILGEGEERQKLIQLAESEGVSERLLLPGFVPTPCDVFALLDVFVLSSRAEGFSLVLAEAASAGIACISAEFDFLRMIYRDDELPMFAQDDLEHMAQVTRYAIQNRMSLGKRIQKRYQSDLTLESMVDRYESLYYEIAATRSKAPNNPML